MIPLQWKSETMSVLLEGLTHERYANTFTTSLSSVAGYIAIFYLCAQPGYMCARQCSPCMFFRTCLLDNFYLCLVGSKKRKKKKKGHILEPTLFQMNSCTPLGKCTYETCCQSPFQSLYVTPYSVM